ncbi:MAG TPA: mannose-1-phosphate guanylyltransferase [Chloroflexota bacterium]|nr:mannose-1-phosphate guanylyltransferase [Chloroflexota bacterium]
MSVRMYVVILAGGSGTRLWPRSRRQRPKHLLELVSERSMLQETFDRVNDAVPAGNVLVVTEQSHAHLIREQLPELPPENILVEPARRGTGPAIGWAAVHIQHRDPDGVMAIFPSDHVIVRRDEFLSVLLLAGELAASTNALLTFGIQPQAASTEFGYIHRGEQHSKHDGRPVYWVESFKEKPEAQRARDFIESGEYFWNSGMFCWKASAILKEIERCMPELSRGLHQLAEGIGSADEEAVVRKVYPSLPKDTIDYGVLEKSKQVLVVPADIGWSDVGTWSALLEVLASESEANVSLAGGELLAIDTRRTLVCAPNKLVATVGVEDLVIVDSDTALLVCHRDRAGEVKQIVEQLEAQARHEHL